MISLFYKYKWNERNLLGPAPLSIAELYLNILQI